MEIKSRVTYLWLGHSLHIHPEGWYPSRRIRSGQGLFNELRIDDRAWEGSLSNHLAQWTILPSALISAYHAFRAVWFLIGFTEFTWSTDSSQSWRTIWMIKRVRQEMILHPRLRKCNSRTMNPIEPRLQRVIQPYDHCLDQHERLLQQSHDHRLPDTWSG